MAFGNYMNSSRRGAVYGFRLESLSKVYIIFIIQLAVCQAYLSKFAVYFAANGHTVHGGQETNTTPLHRTCGGKTVPAPAFIL